MQLWWGLGGAVWLMEHADQRGEGGLGQGNRGCHSQGSYVYLLTACW